MPKLVDFGSPPGARGGGRTRGGGPRRGPWPVHLVAGSPGTGRARAGAGDGWTPPQRGRGRDRGDELVGDLEVREAAARAFDAGDGRQDRGGDPRRRSW